MPVSTKISESNTYQFLLGLSKKYAKTKVAIVGIVTFVTSPYLLAFIIDKYDESKVVSVLMNGQNNLVVEEVFARPDVLCFREKLIKPSSPLTSKNYVIISGEHGTGKTSIMQDLTSKQKNNGGGVIYVSCPSTLSGNFGTAFADAISYSSVYDKGLWRNSLSFTHLLPSAASNSAKDIFKACKPKFMKAIDNYRRDKKMVPILIIDDVNLLCINKEDEELLLDLQTEAKKFVVRVFFNKLGLLFLFLLL
jgi:hypothetical protein